MTHLKIPGMACALVLLCTLWAGLAPFRKPRNAVSWLGNSNGLRFAKHGTVFSSSDFPAAAGPAASECSLELWGRPTNLKASGTLVAFYAPDDPLQFRLQQYHALLILERRFKGTRDLTRVIGIQNAFRDTGPVFLTITSGVEKSAMYVDGALVREFPGYQFGADCHGELILGTSPSSLDSWSGQLMGLAIYRQELTPSQVLDHYQNWTNKGRPELSGREGATGVYLFDERTGSIVHNLVHPGIDLYIPDRFSLWHEPFLTPFWLEFKPNADYLGDVVINILGFMPLGFVFCFYLTRVRRFKHPAAVTIALGFAVSLTIEVLQSYLPTRDSGTTDLITNTLGTFLGVKLYASMAARSLLAKIY
jgi:VanZ family protein